MSNGEFTPKISPNSSVIRVVETDHPGAFGYVESTPRGAKWTFKVLVDGEIKLYKTDTTGDVAAAVTAIKAYARQQGYWPGS